MDFSIVIQTRRSVRSYAAKPIPAEVLGRVLDAARLAPSACNFQPWRFIVVQDAAARRQLVSLAHCADFVAAAPAIIVCCGKRYAQEYNWMGDGLYLVDLGIAIEHLALAARNEGLGTCWIGSFRDAPLKPFLNLPADHDVIMLLPLGYPTSPDQFTAATDRLPLSQIVSHERFGGR